MLVVRRVMRFLSSPQLGTVLVLVWALLLVVWVVPFQFYGLPQQQVRAIIGAEYFFVTVYVAVLVSTVACLIPRFRSIVDRARRIPLADASPTIHGVTRVESGWDAERAARCLARAGFRKRVAGDGWVWGVKRRWAPLGSLLFHGSFLLLAAAVLAGHLLPAFSGSAVLSEGERFTGARPQYEDVETKGPGKDIPRISFTVDSITPRFYRDVLLFTRLDARIRTPGGPRTVAVGTPWFPDASTMVRLEDFGYALEVQDRFAPGAPRQSAYKLHAFPSGQADSFEYASDAPGSNDKYIVTAIVYGDYRPSRRSVPGVASFNLSNPRVLVTIQRLLSNGERRTLVDRRLAKAGTTFRLPSGPFTIAGVSEWGRFRVDREPAMPLFLAAILLGVAGVVVRMAFPRTEALFSAVDDGMAVSVRQDLYGVSAQASRRLAEGWRAS